MQLSTRQAKTTHAKTTFMQGLNSPYNSQLDKQRHMHARTQLMQGLNSPCNSRLDKQRPLTMHTYGWETQLHALSRFDKTITKHTQT